MILTLLNRIPPAVTALLLQCVAVFLSLLTVSLTGLHCSELVLALLCGVYATLLSYLAGQAKWWWLIQFIFAPALVLMLAIDLPPMLFLGIFLVLALVYWSTYRTQVPLYLSSNKVWHALEKFLPESKPDTSFRFVDLGSGLGGVLMHLSKVRPDGQYTGVEAAPLPFFWSWLRIRLGRYHACQVEWGSMWDCDLSRYDVVFAYLSPVPMGKLWLKVKAEMRPSTIFISSTFEVMDQPPSETLQVDDLHNSTLYVWRM